MSERVYIRFGFLGTYFEVEVESMNPLMEEPIGDKPVYRKRWGEVIVKDKPYKYATDSTSKNKLYTEILSRSATEYMFIKHVGNGTDVTEGYFGRIDCEFDATTKKHVKITPEILDQYTDLLEFADTKVDVFALQNQLKNGDFDSVNNDGAPTDWEYLTNMMSITPSLSNFFNNNAVKITNRCYYHATGLQETELTLKQYIISGIGGITVFKKRATIYQDIENINGDNQISLSFFYQLLEKWNPLTRPSILSMVISIYDGVTTKYFNGTAWTTLVSPYYYDTYKLPLPFSEVKGYDFINKILPAPNMSGRLRVLITNNEPTGIDLYDPLDIDYELLDLAYPTYEDAGWTFYESELYLSQIIVNSSTITYSTIKVALPEELVTKSTGRIKNSDGFYYFYDAKAKPSKKFIEDIIDGGGQILEWYFDPVSNAPMIPAPRLSDPVNGFVGNSESGLTWDLDQLEKVFNDPNSDFYMGELSELRLYEKEGYDYTLWPFGGYKTLWARPFYSREEVLSNEKYTQQDEDDGIGDEGDWKPPSEDGNWKETTVNNNGEMLWVRRPFGGEIDYPWELTTSGAGVFWGNENYIRSVVSKKIYPVSENEVIIENSVSLRDVIKKVFNGTHNSLNGKDVYSTFLWNDIPNDESTDILKSIVPGVLSGVNYYTLEDNFLNEITALHTYQLKTERNENDSDAQLLISLNDLMEDMMIIFPNTYYFLDTNKNLHFEHLSYDDIINDAADITLAANGYEKWKYNKNEMFAIVDYNMYNSGYKDFVNATMEFDKIVSNRRRTDIRDSKLTKLITTDIRYCMEKPNDINNGLILLNYNTIAGQNILRYGDGIISKRQIPNGLISLTNMLRLFGKFEGTWTLGRMNGILSAFDHTRWTMEGLETIELKGIYPQKYFLTSIGVGKPRMKTYDYRKGITTVELRYRYNEYEIFIGENEILEI